MQTNTLILVLIGLVAVLFPIFIFVDSPTELFSRDSKTAQVTFTDVTSEVGIDFMQHEYGNEAPGSIWYMTGGVAVGDYNNDGWQDIYLAKVDGPDALYENKSGTHFEDVASSVGLTEDLLTNSASWGDIDNDGDLDLFLSTVNDKRYYLYINNGADGFVEDSVARGVVIDDDGTKFGFSATFVDYDKDGYTDLHTTAWARSTTSRSSSRLFRNLGGEEAGFFEDVTVDAGLVLEDHFSFTSRLTDLNSDEILDLIIVSDFSNSKLFWGNKDGTFVDGTEEAAFGSEENGMGVSVQDYDNDGHMDIFVTSVYDKNATCEENNCKWGATGNRLYRNTGESTFQDVTDEAGVRDGGWGWASNFIDYDNDGDLDLVMGNGINIPDTHLENPYNKDMMRFWTNDGDGTFTEIAEDIGLTNQLPSMGVAVLDYDNDGDQDIIVTNNGNAPILYRNNGGNQNNFLRVYVVEEDGITPALNSAVAIEIEGKTTRSLEIHGGNSYLAQSEAIAHFGLGDTDMVDVVTVTLPDGTKKIFENVEANTTLVVADN